MRYKKIVISAGGSGGHIIPALNIAKALMAKGVEVHYIGNFNSMEEDIITKNNIPFYGIDVQKLYRRFTFKHVIFPFKLIKSIIQCKKYLRQINPDAFIGFGGFVSGPPAYAAKTLNIPVYMQEQNCRPGITNRITSKFAECIFLANKESEKYFKGKKTVLTGNPVNVPENFHLLPKTCSALPEKQLRLLVLGGSQGSLFINNLILNNLDWFKDNNIEIYWQTGKRHLENIQNLIKGKDGIEAFSFTDKLSEYYSQADFIICRGGALTLSEIEIYRKPAFIIPLIGSGVNEQYYNAINFEKQKKGIVFLEKDLTEFTKKIIWFINNRCSLYADQDDVLHINGIEKIVENLLGGNND